MAAQSSKKSDTKLDNNIQYSAPQAKLTYDAWFNMQLGKKLLKSSIKETLRIHMKAYGFLDKCQFDEGKKHFGL